MIADQIELYSVLLPLLIILFNYQVFLVFYPDCVTLLLFLLLLSVLLLYAAVVLLWLL